jgi:hypothetical protein
MCADFAFTEANSYATASTDGSGFFLVSRTASNAWFAQNNAVQNSYSNASTSAFASTIAIGRLNDYASGYSARNIAFASIGTGLTTTEANSLKTAVAAFQTTLSRA